LLSTSAYSALEVLHIMRYINLLTYLLTYHQVAISSHFRDNGHQTYWGHDLDLSGSRDVIGHVAIRFPGAHLL